MNKKLSAPRGSTRKEMTQEEKDWLQNFNQAFHKNDLKALAKIVPTSGVVTDVVVKELTDADNAKRRDIYSQQKAVNIRPTSASSYDEAFDAFVAGDKSSEHYVEDPTLNPDIASDRYTAEDYNPPSFPDEDGLIDLIDHDRAEFEKSKVKDFAEFVAKFKKGKGHGQAS
jgi:hypothetical protein